MVRSVLNRASWLRGLARVPSAAYAIAYLLFIPSFASVYYVLPDHFYHTTMRYERSLRGDIDGLCSSIRRDLLGHWTKENRGHRLLHSGSKNAGELNVDLESLKVRGFRVEEEIYDASSYTVRVDTCLESEPSHPDPNVFLPSGACQPTKLLCWSEEGENPTLGFHCTIDALADPMDTFTVKDNPRTLGVTASAETNSKIKSVIGCTTRFSGPFERPLRANALFERDHDHYARIWGHSTSNNTCTLTRCN